MTVQNSPPTLVDGNTVLRAPRLGDITARVAAGNSRHIQYMYGEDPENYAQITQKQAEDWVRYHMAQNHSWFIDIDDELSGLIFLHSLNKIDRRATLAMALLREADLGKGYGVKALHTVLKHAFYGLNLHRISLRVLDYNRYAIRAYEKVGFVVEGRERQSARVGKVWCDDLIMGILASDYGRGAAA